MSCHWPVPGRLHSRQSDIMDNPWRGEVTLTINHNPCKMRLTLGALARLEAHLSEGSLVELIARFEKGRFSANDVLALLAAGLEGGGSGLKAADLADAEIEGGALAAARAGAELLARSFSLPATGPEDAP